jgi:ferredoxin
MNHLLAEGKFDEAYNVVIQDIALPSILGRICPAPCEGACRRKSVDEAVAICMLKRYTGDEVLKDEEGRSQRFELRILNSEITDSSIPKQEVPRHASRVTRHDSSASRVTRHDSSASRFTRHDSPVTSHHHVAVIGSGPHGLSAAWYLQSFGFQCTVFDRNPLPGGALRYSVPRELLPLETLDAEIDRIRRSGVLFEMNAEIDLKNTAELEDRFDAVVYPLNRALKMAIRASALGKEAAWKVRQRLSGEAETGEPRLFNSRFGRLQEPEFAEYLKESVPGHRVEPARGIPDGLTAEEVMAEAARCLHCECRKADNCLLRNFSDEYRADQKRFQGPERKMVTKQFQHDTVVYEPLKCIKCGICVRITAMHGEEYGLTFIGRGFDVVVGVPFNKTIREGLTKTAEEAAGACPTGALAMKNTKK